MLLFLFLGCLSFDWNFIRFILTCLSHFIFWIYNFCQVLCFHICHQILVVLFLVYLFLVFGINAWSEICCVFYPLVLFIFSLSSYLCVRSTQIPYTNSIVFLLVYHSILFPDLQNPLFSTILFWLILLMKIKIHIINFRASGFCKIEVLEKGQKKNQFKKRNRKKMINITKTVCNPDATTGGFEHWY